MTRLQATFHYSVRGLVVERELLGSSLSVMVEGRDVTITFPTSGSDEPGARQFHPAPAFNERFPERDEVPDGIATTDGVRRAITDALKSVPVGLRRTLTWDQGKELAQHQQITVATGTSVFFCNPHSPWQRGSNENMNGLLRDYFPKGTDLSIHTAEDIERIAAEVNDRPRRTLGWQRPADLLDSAVGAATA